MFSFFSFSDYIALREHFKKEHFLCEDGECAQEQFTGVFRTDIDLKGAYILLYVIERFMLFFFSFSYF